MHFLHNEIQYYLNIDLDVYPKCRIFFGNKEHNLNTTCYNGDNTLNKQNTVF